MISHAHDTSQASTLKESLGNSLLINTVKLFSLLAKADSSVSQAERDYVRFYLTSIYHAPVAEYLYKQFEYFLSENIDAEQAAAQIRTGFSYENRVFILMKVYELAASDTMDDVERETARRIGRMIGLTDPDICKVESIYDLPSTETLEIAKQSEIISITIGDDPQLFDIVLPFPLLDVEIFKIRSIYIILQKNDKHLVKVGNVPIAGKTSRNLLNATKIQHNQSISIDSYTINFEDLSYYFHLKTKTLLGFALFVSRRINPERRTTEFVLSQMPSMDDVLLIEFTKLFIILTPLGVTDSDLGKLANQLVVNGRPVETQVYVNLNDSVLIGNCPINLRKLAFQYGLESEVFTFDPKKPSFTFGNHAECDAIFHDGLSKQWHITVTRKDHASSAEYILDPRGCPHRIGYNGKAVKKPQILPAECHIFISKQVFHCSFLGGVVRSEPFRFRDFIARNVRYSFQDNTLALDDISFEIDYGDLVAVMGPSGCGKSTLLNIMNGYNKPNDGNIEINAYDLHHDYQALKDYLGYVPQDDLLFENLTVYENLMYNARLRHPDMSDEEICTLVEQTLVDIDLVEKRNVKVGSPTQRTLSGGQRKRLNIGLELLADADVYFLDEPTSGLSSKDSEKIIELLQRLTLKGKIVFVVIHQPSSKIYKMFNKILFLDKGGKTAFFGDTMAALAYFKTHSLESHVSASPVNPEVAAEMVECPVCKNVEPDLLLETLEEPLRDIDGVPLSQRKYTPMYWKEKFLDFRASVHRLTIEDSERVSLPQPRELSLREKWRQFTTLLQRNFVNKFRDRSNLIITFFEAPALALAVSFILRHAADIDAEYNLFQNDNLAIFIFLAVIIATFLAITNSIDEIIKDAAVLLRERMLNIGNLSYYASKFITLVVFALLQNALFIIAAFPILQLQELHAAYLLFLTLVSIVGIATGLLISALPNLSAKAAFNIVPLVLIPQIIFGGALIPYSEMTHLKFNTTREIPEICQLIPARWAYEGLITMQDRYNRFQSRDDELQAPAKNILRVYDERDAALQERNSLLAQADSSTLSAELQTKLVQLNQSIERAEREIDAYEQNKASLDSAVEQHRLQFQDKYGNQEIHRQVLEAQDKLHAMLQALDSTGGVMTQAHIGLFDYPMLIHEKRMFFSQKYVPTVCYNAVVLICMTIFTVLLSLGLLSVRERLLDTTLRITKLFQHK
ncbi:MAG: ATP-binding cassette domain-containing protein [Bacteroidota bacterium]|nr:ATP-binding cassette domain-containing protein [Candidatus Kapabacteria bacterium]MDW8218988.1 ATP-binding cassette domain-containing protein [Bacteroidota bacterium]